jgi:hypothetical protein
VRVRESEGKRDDKLSGRSERGQDYDTRGSTMRKGLLPLKTVTLFFCRRQTNYNILTPDWKFFLNRDAQVL